MASDRALVICVVGGERATLVGFTTAVFAGVRVRPLLFANDAGMQDAIIVVSRIIIRIAF